MKTPLRKTYTELAEGGFFSPVNNELVFKFYVANDFTQSPLS